jgi:hypothetical protein
MGFSRPLISIDGKPLRDHAGAMPMRPGGIMVYWIDCNAKAAVISFDQAGMDGQNIKGSWPVVSTAMFCPDYEEGPSHGVGDAVAAVESWRLDDLGMLVLEGGGHTLVFGPEPGRPLPIGRAWLAAARQP